MPMLKTYNLFISHAWSYGYEYDKLIELLDNEPYFWYKNYSAPSEKPLVLSSDYVSNQEIKAAIDRKIAPVHCVIILGGMYAYREWMQYELEAAHKFNKPIIVVAPWGQQKIPAILSGYPIVRWNTNSIVDAIRHYSI